MNHPITAQTRIPTPLGPLTAAATDAGLAGLWFDGQAHHPGPIDAPVQPGQRWLAAAAQQLQAYFGHGPGHAAWPTGDTLALDLHGTPFQRAVWQALRGVAPGRTVSYGTLAAQLGRPAAVRAVGAAVGRNPVSVLVPCHRVLGHAGALTGYAGGLERKRALLVHEGVLLA